MIRLILGFVFAAICMVQFGCSYETRTPQYSVAIYVNRNDDVVLRAMVEGYAKSHGYAEKKSASIQDELIKQGIVLWSFHAADRSFISFTNAVVVNCYDLGVYSAKNPLAARTVAQEITKLLDRDPGNLRIDSSGVPCSKK